MSSYRYYWSNCLEKSGIISITLIFLIYFIAISNGYYYQHQQQPQHQQHQQAHYPQQCSTRLENALEHIFRRNRMKMKSRTYLDLTPYSMYNFLYRGGEQHSDTAGIDNLDDDLGGGGGDGPYHHGGIITTTSDTATGSNDNNHNANNNDSKKNLPPIGKVEVAQLRVRVPSDTANNKGARWVQVDKCQFTAANRTLDTRLVFPDLTISGKVILHPSRGRCNMILRLRRAGIEFHTIPLISNEDARLSRIATVRTDSHFSEPGFLSVFAHGCQGSTSSLSSSSSSSSSSPSPTSYSTRRHNYNNKKYHHHNHHDPNHRQNSKWRDFEKYPYSTFIDVDDINNERNGERYGTAEDSRRQQQYNDNGDNDGYSHRSNDEYNSINNNNHHPNQQKHYHSDGDYDKDVMNFNDEILEMKNSNDIHEKSRTFANIFSGSFLAGDHNNGGNSHRYPSSSNKHPHTHPHPHPHHHHHHSNSDSHSNQWHNAADSINSNGYGNDDNNYNNEENGGGGGDDDNDNDDKINEQLTRELEELFSIGIRGLLTTYMQKALQPAIKETLMENMGYTLSYG